MYTKTFEADSLDLALKQIKQELGPDAIILKTVTNKGLKGAFKKKKIEITAAIPEKNLVNKMKVDKVLNTGEREEFYNSSASQVSEMIDSYNREPSTPSTYGKMGLNKNVQNKNSKGQSLDEFLSRPKEIPSSKVERPVETRQPDLPEPQPMPTEASRERVIQASPPTELLEVIEAQREEIDRLRVEMLEIKESMSKRDESELAGVGFLRKVLKAVNIDDSVVIEVLKKVQFDLDKNELENKDLVFDHALSYMASLINVGLPLFSRVNSSKETTVTVLLSEGVCGQTTLFQKMGSLVKDSKLIQFGERKEGYADKFLGLELINVETVAELISECRKCNEKGESVLIDFSREKNKTDETIKFIDTLKRSFDNVEILLTLSAINSETYNRRVFRKFEAIIDAVNYTCLDLTLEPSEIFNLHMLNNSLPLYFFSTGETIPEDLEAASVERLIGTIFGLDKDEKIY